MIFNASVSFFAFEPVLKALQSLTRVPMSPQLALMQPASPPLLPHAEPTFQPSDDIISKAAKGIAHQGVLCAEQIGPQVAILIQHCLTDGGDILRRKLLRQKLPDSGVSIDGTDVELCESEIGGAGTQAM